MHGAGDVRIENVSSSRTSWRARIEPGKVLDRDVRLDGVPDAYRAMADRESIKVMVTPIARLGTADEMPAAVLWLCSPGASFVVGVALPRGWRVHGAVIAPAPVHVTSDKADE